MVSSTTDTAGPFSTPAWEQIADEIICPMCWYNLRGLQEPRCPECGYRFTWPEVLDPARRRHPFLFEQHPHNNFWSFRKTLLATLRPSRFFSKLHPAHIAHVGRALMYALICSLPYLAAASLAAVRVLFRWNAIRTMFAGFPRVPRPSLPMYVGAAKPMVLFMLPWLSLIFTLLALAVFQISMRRRGVDRRHLLRCVVYAGDAFFWAGLVLLVMMGFEMVMGPSLAFSELISFSCMLVWATGQLAVAWRLVAAYRYYMRFDHPVATVLASQVIMSLALLNVAMVCTYWI